MDLVFSFVLGLALGFAPTSFLLANQNSTTVLGADDQAEQEIIETPTFTPSPSPSPTLSPTLTPSPTPSPSPTQTPTPTPIPQTSYSSEQIQGFIERFAGQYNVDVNILRHIAVCESGFNPASINGAYAGLYQFSVNTWANYRQQMGEDANPDLRLNAEEAVQTAAYVLAINRAYIWPNCVP